MVHTADPKKLQRLSLLPYHISGQVEEVVREEWLELDGMLLKLWTSHALRPTVFYRGGGDPGTEGRRDCVVSLLPELVREGVVDPIEVEVVGDLPVYVLGGNKICLL